VIEDIALVTIDGHQNLDAPLPLTTDELERLTEVAIRKY